MQEPRYADREWLRSRYEDRRLSLRQIAVEAGAGLRTVARWMTKHGIATRDRAVAQRQRDRSGRANPNWKGAAICPNCGGRRSYKTRLCMNCRVAARVGTGNSNWRGGVTAENVRGRTTPAYVAWRGAVFARDEHACRRCGDRRGGNLHAHHVLPWADHPDLRFDPANGITLCEPCHARAHAVPYRPGRRTAIGSRTLASEDRDSIRRIYGAGGISQKRLAARYGVSEATISRLVNSG